MKRYGIMKVLLSLYLLMYTMSLTGCRDLATDLSRQPVGKFVFEVEHRNSAWGVQLSGWLIDSSGQLFEYRNNAFLLEYIYHRRDTVPLTNGELLLKYNRLTYITTVNKELLASQFSTASAVKGPLKDAVGVCADFGSITFSALDYSTMTKIYTPVILRIEGDVCQRHSDSRAEVVVQWLKSIGNDMSSSPCSCP